MSDILEFGKDHQFESYKSAILEGRYRLLDRDRIVFRSRDGQEEKFVLEWNSRDRARMENESAETSYELERVGKAADPETPLAGEWNTTRDWSGRAYPADVLFFADGRYIWVIKLRSEKGSYSVDGQSIRLEIPNRPVIEGSFAVSGDHLTLPNPNGGTSSFDRF